MSAIKTIKFSGKKVFITKDSFIPIEQTNIPNSCLFNPDQNIYWRIAITFDKDSGIVYAKVILYSCGPADFYSQKKKGDVEFIEFDDINFDMIESSLSSYRRADFVGIDKNVSPIKEPVEVEEYHLDKSTEIKNHQIKKKKNNPAEDNFKEVTYVSLDELDFHLGYVEFEKHPYWSRSPVNIRIHNPHIIPEFKHVTKYLEKIIGKKVIDVILSVKKVRGELVELEAASEDINKITADTLKFTQRMEVKGFLSFQKKSSKNKMYSSREVIDKIDKGKNYLGHSELGLLELLSDLKGVRNSKELDYLSGIKFVSKDSLMFTFTPQLGFLYLVKTHATFFCWELLHSNATYIWSSDSISINRIEEELAIIESYGREVYRKFYRSKKLSTDLDFKFVFHNSFDEWQKNINKLIGVDPSQETPIQPNSE